MNFTPLKMVACQTNNNFLILNKLLYQCNYLLIPKTLTDIQTTLNLMKTLILLLILGTSLSRPDVSRLLASSISYASHGKDWTGTCATGGLQSPIDIDTVVGTCDNTMVFDISFTTSDMKITVYRQNLHIRR